MVTFRLMLRLPPLKMCTLQKLYIPAARDVTPLTLSAHCVCVAVAVIVGVVVGLQTGVLVCVRDIVGVAVGENTGVFVEVGV